MIKVFLKVTKSSSSFNMTGRLDSNGTQWVLFGRLGLYVDRARQKTCGQECLSEQLLRSDMIPCRTECLWNLELPFTRDIIKKQVHLQCVRRCTPHQQATSTTRETREVGFGIAPLKYNSAPLPESLRRHRLLGWVWGFLIAIYCKGCCHRIDVGDANNEICEAA
jgi:hypothetical protein